MNERFPGFVRSLEMMRDRDAMTQEEGFCWLHSRAEEFFDELVLEFENESDHWTKGWLLELIAETLNPKATKLLIQQLRSDNDYLKAWAIHGLKALDTPESRRALFELGERD